MFLIASEMKYRPKQEQASQLREEVQVIPVPKGTQLEVLRLTLQTETLGSLVRQLGFSAGKTHYILTTLIEKGLIKAERFKRSNNKLVYRYLLTPQGVMRRIALTEKYIQHKRQEYETLQHELE